MQRQLPVPAFATRSLGPQSQCQLTSHRESIDETKWHDQAQIRRWIIPSFWFHRRCPLWCLEREIHLISRDVPQDFQQIARIESDIELISRIADSQFISCFTQIRRLHAEAKNTAIER